MSGIEALRDACRQLQFAKHLFFQEDSVVVRSSGQQRASAHLGRAERVVETLSGNRIYQASAVADHRPAFAADFERFESLGTKRRENVRVEAGIVQMEAVLSEPLLQYAAQLGSRDFTHLARDPGGNMVRAREDPDVAGDAFQKLNLHKRAIARRAMARNEVAGGDHQIAGRNR
jgi:hypothetical protein